MRRPPTLRFRRLRFATRLVAVRLTLPALLATISLPRILRWIDAPIRATATRPPHELASTTSWIERQLSRGQLLPNTCLYRSLARYSALRDAGIPVRFVMGVRPEKKGEIVGHAWLEWRGSALGETIDPRYVVTFSHPEICEGEGHVTTPTLAPNPDVLFTELGDGTGVLLHLRTKFYFTLNRTGVFVWKALDDVTCQTPERIAERLSTVFEIGGDDALHDVLALVGEMAQEQLLIQSAA